MEKAAHPRADCDTREGPAPEPRNLTRSLWQLPNTSTDKLAVVALFPPPPASPQPRILGRCLGPTTSGVASRSESVDKASHSDARDIHHRLSKRPRMNPGLLWPAGPTLQAIGSTNHRTRARHSFRRGISKPGIVEDHLLETIFEDAPPVRPRVSRVHSTFSFTATEHIQGKTSAISGLHLPTFWTPAVVANSSKPPTVSVPSANTTTTTILSSSSSSSSASFTIKPRQPIPITAPFLSGLLTTLTAWRFRTFYADFLHKPLHFSDSDDPAALIAPLKSALSSLDWVRMHIELEAQRNGDEAWKKRGLGCCAPLFASQWRMYKAVCEACKINSISLRQVRKVVEVYAFWAEREGQRHDQGRRANGMGRTLTVAWLAEEKQWERLAKIILEDLEDLQGAGTWVGRVFGCDGRHRVEMMTAIDKCRETHFSYLAFGEEEKKKKKEGCKKVVGRLAGRLCKVGNLGLSMGLGGREKEEKRLSKGRKIEWALSPGDGDGSSGKDRLIREMHKRHKRAGVKEARVAEERFMID